MAGKTISYFSIMLVALVLGLMLTLQFRVASHSSGEILTDRAQEILDKMKQIDRDKESLIKEISDLTYKLEQVNRGKSEALNALNSELEKARISACMIAVTGPGVEVVLDNPEKENGGRLPPKVYVPVILTEDLLKVVNELWGAGAEAISINGQRIISKTEIRLAGEFININTQRVVPPYQILAIGDSDTLAATLELPGGLVDYLRNLGIELTVEKHQELIVPAYTEI